MQVYELLRLTEWFETNIVKAGIPDKYSALHNAMNKNVKRASNQQAQPFQNEKESLIEAIKPINFKSLSIEQIHFLEKLGVTELLGEIGANKIEQVLYINNLDLASATKEIGNFSKKINSAQSTINQISETLGKSFSIEDDKEIDPEHVMMRVYFQDKQSIKNLSDFKKLSTVWFDIGRGISMAMDKSPEDFRLLVLKKGLLSWQWLYRTVLLKL